MAIIARAVVVAALPTILANPCGAAISASMEDGFLRIASDAADDIVVTAAGGEVLANGASLPGGSVSASDVESLAVIGGPGENLLDLSGVTADAGFSNLSGPVVIEGGAGDDGISGGGFGHVIDPGPGDDVAFGAGLTDRFVWSPGDGDDEFVGGDSLDFLDVIVPDDSTGEDFQLAGTIGSAGFNQIDGAEHMATIFEIETVSVEGGPGDDSLRVDSLFASSVDTVEFDGGEGDDVLDAAGTEAIVMVGYHVGDGSDSIAGGTIPADTLTVVGSSGDDSLSLGFDGETVMLGGDGSAVSTIADIDSATILTTLGNDDLRIESLDGTAMTSVTAFLGSGDDVLTAELAIETSVVANGGPEDESDTLRILTGGNDADVQGDTVVAEGFADIGFSDFELVDLIDRIASDVFVLF